MPALAPKELAERLRLKSPALVDEIYSIAQRQTQAEAGRQTRLDAKASSLLTAAGLSLTVAFTFGGQVLLARATELRQLGAVRWSIVLVTFLLAIVTGLLASIFAVMALRVREYLSVNEQTVFDVALCANDS